MLVKLLARKNYASHVSQVAQAASTPYYYSKTGASGKQIALDVHIQRPSPGEKIDTTILGEISLVSRVNTPILLQVVQGDLTHEMTDAIVNPTDQFG